MFVIIISHDTTHAHESFFPFTSLLPSLSLTFSMAAATTTWEKSCFSPSPVMAEQGTQREQPRAEAREEEP